MYTGGGSAPDFLHLAATYPDRLGPFVKEASGYGVVDFEDPVALRALTETILLHDYGVHLTLMPQRLCPIVQNRLNYIRWIAHLLDNTLPTLDLARSSEESIEDPTDSERPAKRQRVAEAKSNVSAVRLLDIGTGASAIYPLLGCASYDDWTFTATDIDAASLSHARTTVEDPQNNAARPPSGSNSAKCKICTAFASGRPSLDLAKRIKLLLRHYTDFLIPLDPPCNSPTYHATLSNPPFYSSLDEVIESRGTKAGPPSGACEATFGEMVTEGGEVAFVKRMIRESTEGAGKQVVWFTTMLGKYASLAPLLDELKACKIENFTTTAFLQGRTRRWGLAWTLTGVRLARPMPIRMPPTPARPHVDTSASEVDSAAASAYARAETRSLLSQVHTLPLGPSNIVPLPLPDAANPDLDAAALALQTRLRAMLQDIDGRAVPSPAHAHAHSEERPLWGQTYRLPSMSWSRAARRARERARSQAADTSAKPAEGTKAAEVPFLLVHFELRPSRPSEESHDASSSDAPAGAPDAGDTNASAAPRRPFLLTVTFLYGASHPTFLSLTQHLASRLLKGGG